ncbi:ABC transporter, permease protein, putative [Synechococcus sp. PCC 7335]|uniref:carbohydrate ABC transporter permease n=1 Tax=Synechococcus sp. (strain ATCC 29403 / PCC 7335) TaxID=91464 RepID=UPI00017EB488|nr:sugar ABC transporter permease [Synechococcus sp. PCC 7335]EDX85095.1 ABC transporter, permease protein, putative [Synechococcus sp. PCC 7335]
MDNNLLLILRALLAIALGSGGVIAIFYGLNILVEKALPKGTQRRILPWIYVGPSLLLLLVYLVLPTIRTIYLSFFNNDSSRFVGLRNYIFAFTSPDMLIAFRNNLLWLVLVTGISVGLGLIIAVLVDRVRYEPLAKSLIFLPMAISFVGASVIWRFVYAYRPAGSEQIGLLNAVVTFLGFEPIGWLVERDINNFALIAIMIWLQTGFCMVLLSSAVKGVPKDVIEAARVDGANEFQIFRRIIVPMIMPTVTVVSTTVIVLVLKVFDIVFVMTGGNLDTDVIASRMVREMFNFRNFGRGSAIAVILLIAVIPVMVANIRRFRQQELDR